MKGSKNPSHLGEHMERLENHLIMVVEWQLNLISMHFRFLAINHNYIDA